MSIEAGLKTFKERNLKINPALDKNFIEKKTKVKSCVGKYKKNTFLIGTQMDSK